MYTSKDVPPETLKTFRTASKAYYYAYLKVEGAVFFLENVDPDAAARLATELDRMWPYLSAEQRRELKKRPNGKLRY